MHAVFEKKDYFQLNCLTVKGFRGFIPMFHPHAELVYVIDGSIPITVDGCTHILKSGEIGILFPYLTHSYENAPDSDVIIMLFDPACTAFDNTLLTKKPACFHAQAEALYPLLDRAVIMHRKGRIKTAMAYLNAVIGELLEVLPLVERRADADTFMQQLLAYCADHYTEDISVKHIANALYVSESYVSKVFSKKLGYSFREYINTLRIQKAQALLRDTDLQILQVMAACGFQNQSSFNRVFRQISGTAPKQYRSNARRH